MPIAAHDLRAFGADLARFSDVHRFVVVAEQLNVGRRQGQASRAGEIVDVGRVERQHRAGFRQPVALAYEGTGNGFPAARDLADDGGTTASGKLQPRPVDLADPRVHRQARVQCIDAHENCRPRLRQRVDETVRIPRVDDQPVLGADGKVRDEIHHQRKNMIERNRRDDDFLARSNRIRHDRLELLGICDEVSM